MATDLNNTKAFDVIKKSIIAENYLGQGDERAVFALKGFGDDTLDHKYAMRIDRHYVPETALKTNELGNDHHPWFTLDELLKSSTCLTPPNQLYVGSKVSQPLLRDLEQLEDKSNPRFTIVPRHAGKSVLRSIEEQTEIAHMFGGEKMILDATSRAAEAFIEKLEKNPQLLIDLFREAYELGLNGVKISDGHLGNVMIDEHDRLSIIDTFNGADNKPLVEPHKTLFAEENVDELYDGMATRLSELYAPEDSHLNYAPRVQDLFDSCKTKAEEASLSAPHKPSATNGQHSAGFALVDDISANPIRIDQHSSAKDLLSALNKLHASINTGPGL